MKKIVLMAMVIGLVVSGCAYKGWVRTDGKEVTYSNWIGDHQDCYFHTANFGLRCVPVFGDIYSRQKQQAYEKCMEEKGYHKKEASK